MTYTPYYPAGWVDSPSTSTPIIAAALQNIEDGLTAAATLAEDALPLTGGTLTGLLAISAASGEGLIVSTDGTDTADGAFIVRQGFFGIYNTITDSYYGIAENTGSLASGDIGLVGFYEGLAVVGSSASYGDLIFAALAPGQTYYAVGSANFTVTGGGYVSSFNNVLDDGSGAATFTGDVTINAGLAVYGSGTGDTSAGVVAGTGGAAYIELFTTTPSWVAFDAWDLSGNLLWRVGSNSTPGLAFLTNNAGGSGTGLSQALHIDYDQNAWFAGTVLVSSDGTETSDKAVWIDPSADGGGIFMYNADDGIAYQLAANLFGTATATPFFAGFSGGWVAQSAYTNTGNISFSVGNSVSAGSGIGNAMLTAYDNGVVTTYNNTLDDGTGEATFVGAVNINRAAGGPDIHISNSANPGMVLISGTTTGSNWSFFVLADDVYPLDAAGHYWAFTHDDDHSFALFNYDGAGNYTNALYGLEGGYLQTKNNILDNGYGNVTLTGELLLQRPGTSAEFTLTGQDDGDQYSNFNLADDVYPLDGAGHYWSFSHRSDHSFLIYNYDGSVYNSVLSFFENGGLYTLNNTLDDGSGAATLYSLVVSTGGIGITAGGLGVLADGAYIAGGLTVNDTGLTVSAGGLIVTAGGLTVTAGLSSFAGGTDTSGTAAYSVPTFASGTAKQLSTAQDVVLMINVKVATNLTLAMGSTSSVTTTVMTSATAGVGVITLHVPKGHYVKATSSGTFSNFVFTQLTR